MFNSHCSFQTGKLLWGHWSGPRGHHHGRDHEAGLHEAEPRHGKGQGPPRRRTLREESHPGEGRPIHREIAPQSQKYCCQYIHEGGTESLHGSNDGGKTKTVPFKFYLYKIIFYQVISCLSKFDQNQSMCNKEIMAFQKCYSTFKVNYQKDKVSK